MTDQDGTQEPGERDVSPDPAKPDGAQNPAKPDGTQDPADQDGAQTSEDDRDFEFLVESRLSGFAVYLTDFAETDEGYALTYESIAADETGAIPHREVGRIVNVFRDIEDDPVAIDATVTDLDGTPLGTWEAPRDWLADLEDGDMTEVEFSEQVIDSIEPVDGDDASR